MNTIERKRNISFNAVDLFLFLTAIIVIVLLVVLLKADLTESEPASIEYDIEFTIRSEISYAIKDGDKVLSADSGDVIGSVVSSYSADAVRYVADRQIYTEAETQPIDTRTYTIMTSPNPFLPLPLFSSTEPSTTESRSLLIERPVEGYKRVVVTVRANAKKIDGELIVDDKAVKLGKNMTFVTNSVWLDGVCVGLR